MPSVSAMSLNGRSLNPCFNGRYSLSMEKIILKRVGRSLNPCFNGRYSLSTVEIPEALAELS